LVSNDGRTVVRRAVVDEHELGVEVAFQQRCHQRADRVRQVPCFVVNRDDDAERGSHRARTKPSRKPATYVACVRTIDGRASSPTATERNRSAASAAVATTVTPYAATRPIPTTRPVPVSAATRTQPTSANASGRSENAVAALTLAPRARLAAAPRILAWTNVASRCGRTSGGGRTAIDVSGV